jgi:hypothetical protein
MTDAAGTRPVLTGLVCLVALATAGCGRPVPAGMVRIEGVVLLDGSPLRSETGALNFAAQKGTSTGSARIQPDGSFTVDLMPGEYLVAVRVTDGYDQLGEAGKPPRRAKSLIPERYAEPGTSGLTVAAVAKATPVKLAIDAQ